MPKKNYDAIIRHEFSGPVIWSHDQGKYFIAKDKDGIPLINEALADIQNGVALSVDKYGEELVADLAKLGAMGNTKVIWSPFSDRLSAPLEVYFDYTWVCNLAKKKCGLDSFCYARDFLGKQTMDSDAVTKLMNDLADWGVMRVHLAGGEPTSLKDELGNYLQSAYDAGLVTSMATNGILMTRKMSELVMDRDIYSVTFSFDGHDEATFAEVRGAGLFDKALKGFRTFKQVRDEYRADGRPAHTKTCIKPTFSPYTPKEVLRGVVQLAVDEGADIIKLANPERCLYHEKGYYGKIRDDYYAQGQYVGELVEEFKDQITIFGINNPLLGGVDKIGLPGTKGCIGGQELLAINPDGSLTPCLMHNYELGNLNEFGDLKDAWERSTKFKAFRDSIEEPKKCGSCNLRDGCRSGSTTRKIVEVGEFNAANTSGKYGVMTDPLCPADFMQANPSFKPKMTPVRGPFKHFVPVNVLHSL